MMFEIKEFFKIEAGHTADVTFFEMSTLQRLSKTQLQYERQLNTEPDHCCSCHSRASYLPFNIGTMSSLLRSVQLSISWYSLCLFCL